MVKKELLSKACEGSKWHVNNKYDRSRQPKGVKEIVHRALCFVGQEIPYNALNLNCEHFATYLRYGEPESKQVRTIS